MGGSREYASNEAHDDRLLLYHPLSDFGMPMRAGRYPVRACSY
jgi:hypothetical protein